jgi:hypothetical protein
MYLALGHIMWLDTYVNWCHVNKFLYTHMHDIDVKTYVSHA